MAAPSGRSTAARVALKQSPWSTSANARGQPTTIGIAARTSPANATARNETSFSLYMNQSKKNLTTRIGPAILILSADKRRTKCSFVQNPYRILIHMFVMKPYTPKIGFVPITGTRK